MERRISENNKKRNAWFGILILFTFGIIFFSLMNSSAISGCAGDCMTCHPVLKGSKEHKSLTTCINCHKPASSKILSFSNNNGCGDRCFQCHGEWPKDAHHASLNTCLNCHEK